MTIPQFTAHNLRLNDGSFTMGNFETLDQTARWKSTENIIDKYLEPGDSVLDIGSLEGGYTALMAQKNLNATGLEIRDSNLSAAHFLKNNLSVSGNLNFIKKDMHDVANLEKFDFVYCVGALYHSHRPRKLLQDLISITKKVLLLHTHVSPDKQTFDMEVGKKQRLMGKINTNFWYRFYSHDLSKLSINEEWSGRWYREPYENDVNSFDENQKWASWGNAKSFWPLEVDLVSDLLSTNFKFVYHDFSAVGFNSSAAELNEVTNRAVRRQYLAIK